MDSAPIRDRESALGFLFDRINYERTRTVPYRTRRFKLDRMRQLAQLLGNPEHNYPAIHIAGTKGKGSTASMIAAALTAAGMRTGLYTSPHLQRLEERFVVDGEQCTEAELVTLMTDIQAAVHVLDVNAAAQDEFENPTYFEITTAAALLHFQRRQVDCAVLEVGLGGRLDSTNICRPAISVVTTISLDHTRQLGNTPAKIAAEKAGIIKPDVPVVTGVRQPEPFQVIEAIAQQNGCRLIAAGRDFDFDYIQAPVAPAVPRAPTAPADAADPETPEEVDALRYREQIDGVARTWERVDIGMLGRHQAANAAVALATLGQLQQLGWKLDDSAIRDGLAHARCPARFEVVAHDPTVILDAAHNPASVAALCEALDDQFPERPRLLVFATSIDKDVPSMLKLLLPHFEQVILTRYLNNPRAMDPDEVEGLTRDLLTTHASPHPQVEIAPDPRAAWLRVRSLATPAHVICVAGSFFLAAEIRQQMEPTKQERANQKPGPACP